MGILRVKYLCEVYGVRGSSVGGSEVEYPRKTIEMEGINIPDSIMIDINKEWGVSRGILK